jgi:hypothetical protein
MIVFPLVSDRSNATIAADGMALLSGSHKAKAD